MRVEPEVTEHPKFARLKRRIGDVAMEALIRLWGHCQTNQRGGVWPGADDEYVEIVCRWDGEKGLLFRSLVETGWIERIEGGLTIHDWDEMNSQTVANWRNGPRGGRPPKTNRKPSGKPVGIALGSQSVLPISGDVEKGNPTETQWLTQFENGVTHRKPSALSIYPSFSPSIQEPIENPVVNQRVSEPEQRFDLAQQAVEELNRLTGAHFRGTHLELNLAAACLARVGNDLPGVKKMLARQKALWATDARMASCLQPRTLFDPEKFDAYYAQRDLPTTAGDPVARRRELEELIAKSPANRQSVFHNPQAPEAEVEKLKKWRAELAGLNHSKGEAA